MSTVAAPFVESAIVKVKFGLLANKLLWRVSSTVYRSRLAFQVNPKVSSNMSHAAEGRYIYGREESIKVSIGEGSKDAVDPVEFTEVMDLRPTTRSREMSSARWNGTLLATNLEAS